MWMRWVTPSGFAGSVQKLPGMLVAPVSQAVRLQWCWLSAVWTLCSPVCCGFGGTGKVKNKFITRLKKEQWGDNLLSLRVEGR